MTNLLLTLLMALILYKNNIKQEGGTYHDKKVCALILYKNNIKLVCERKDAYLIEC